MFLGCPKIHQDTPQIKCKVWGSISSGGLEMVAKWPGTGARCLGHTYSDLGLRTLKGIICKNGFLPGPGSGKWPRSYIYTVDESVGSCQCSVVGCRPSSG